MKTGPTSPYHIQYFNDGGKMEKNFIMTAFGKDRPGIVADVAKVIYESGCNLDDSTMTRLADEFTLILLLSGQGDDLEEQLHKECRRLEIEKKLSAFIRPVEVKRPASRPGNMHTIRVEGPDQAGIVYKISKFLAENQINVENLTSKKTFSPESGAAIYQMKMEVHMPDTVSLDDAEKGLSRIENDLNVDITIS
jgi:glycine cleavage system transcriptional repressor